MIIFAQYVLSLKIACTTEIHKTKEKSDITPLRPFVSSVNSYNNNLAGYLSELLTPLIQDLKFSENELGKLFRFATLQIHFYFD